VTQCTQTTDPELARVLQAGIAPEQGIAREVLGKLLHAVRAHLHMEGAFVAQFEGGRRVFRVVDAEPGKCAVPVGASDPLEDSYCQRVVDGRLPELICNAQDLPAARELAVTEAFPVGAHLSIPLRLADGSIYGTFCCFSRAADYTLSPRDLELMRTFADIAATVIQRDLREADEYDRCRERIEAVLRGEGLTMV
jgi:GAF domain-containing protein